MPMDLKTLNDLVAGFRPARVLHVACSLNIFTILSGGVMLAAQLAARCQAKPDQLEKLLIACTAMGLLEKNGDSWANTDFAKTYLVEGAELYQGHIIAHSASLWDFWGELEDAVRLENVPRPEPDAHRNFIMGMHNIAASGRAKWLANAADLTGRKQLVDIGGGPGTYSIELCRQFPGLRAIIFDLPETAAIAREVIGRAHIQDRVTVRPGSWDTDDFGTGNDVALISNVLHGPASNARMKLGKAFRSMTPGGLLIIQDFILNDDKTGPLIPAIFNIMLGAYSRPELFVLIEQAGFVRPRVVACSEESGQTVIVAEKM